MNSLMNTPHPNLVPRPTQSAMTNEIAQPLDVEPRTIHCCQKYWTNATRPLQTTHSQFARPRSNNFKKIYKI